MAIAGLPMEIMVRMKVNERDTVDGQNPANQLRLVVFWHYLQGFSTIPGGCLGFLNHQQVCFDQIPHGRFSTNALSKASGYVAQR